MVGLYNGLWMSFTHLPHSPSSTTLNAAFTTKGLCTFSNSSNQKSKSARLPEAATPRSLATACETLGRGKHCAARQPPKATLRSLERRRLACETPVDGNILVRNKIPTHAQPTQARRLLSRHSPRGRLWQEIINACTTDAGDGNFLRGRVNAAQPGNRRRRFAPQRAQASSPAKRSAVVTCSARWVNAWRCETQHHPLRGLCTFDFTYLGLVLTDFTRG